jgi:hypothetical protein
MATFRTVGIADTLMLRAIAIIARVPDDDRRWLREQPGMKLFQIDGIRVDAGHETHLLMIEITHKNYTPVLHLHR